MIVLHVNPMAPNLLLLRRSANELFSEWWKAYHLASLACGSEYSTLPLSKLPQVIAVLRLNGIEVELGEGL